MPIQYFAAKIHLTSVTTVIKNLEPLNFKIRFQVRSSKINVPIETTSLPKN